MKQYLSFLKPINIKGKIRLGNPYDGGYVIYGNILEDTTCMVSYGVGWDTSFEEHFNTNTKKSAYMFDPNMYTQLILDKSYLKRLIYAFRFRQVWDYVHAVYKWTRHIKHLAKKDIFLIKEGLTNQKIENYDTLVNHNKRFALPNQNILLKIDIEGGEYSILSAPDILEYLNSTNQMIIEFHDLKNNLVLLNDIISNLAKEFTIVHIHGNNFGEMFTLYDFEENGRRNIKFPDIVEITFVKTLKILEDDLLHLNEIEPVKNLDFPNNPNKQDYSINFI